MSLPVPSPSTERTSVSVDTALSTDTMAAISADTFT